MKRILLILLALRTAALIAQQSEIKGIISIHNSKFETGKTEYVANVQIKESFGRGQETLSNTDGRFDFIPIGIPFKETINLFAKKEKVAISECLHDPTLINLLLTKYFAPKE